MVSRAEIELLLKTQRDAYNDCIAHVKSSFESRLSKLEAELSAAKLETADLRRNCEIQNNRINSLLQRVDDFNEPLEKAQNADSRIDYLEDQSRRNNLRIDGIPENDSENWEQTTKKVQDLFKNNLGIKKLSQLKEPIVLARKFHPKREQLWPNFISTLTRT